MVPVSDSYEFGRLFRTKNIIRFQSALRFVHNERAFSAHKA
jgi:hypothetical protein